MSAASVSTVVFRKGLNMKAAVAAELAASYDSAVVDEIREQGFVQTRGRLTLHLAREFHAGKRCRAFGLVVGGDEGGLVDDQRPHRKLGEVLAGARVGVHQFVEGRVMGFCFLVAVARVQVPARHRWPGRKE